MVLKYDHRERGSARTQSSKQAKYTHSMCKVSLHAQPSAQNSFTDDIKGTMEQHLASMEGKKSVEWRHRFRIPISIRNIRTMKDIVCESQFNADLRKQMRQKAGNVALSK